LHASVYRLTGGALIGTVRGRTTLLLTTTGRKSGKRRTRPLLYRVDAERYVVVASNFGADRPPAWWLNLRHNPAAEIVVDRRTIPVVATEADAADRDRLWSVFEAMYPGYARYRARTSRPIPVIILTPVEPGRSTP
jgi:deazaflavin-dependent oxidoreductase (nitroreductase family)